MECVFFHQHFLSLNVFVQALGLPDDVDGDHHEVMQHYNDLDPGNVNELTRKQFLVLVERCNKSFNVSTDSSSAQVYIISIIAHKSI